MQEARAVGIEKYDLMSDDSKDQHQVPLKGHTQNPEPKESLSKRSLFGNLNQDLKQALDTWELLTEEVASRMSPEEEQLMEVKKLLGELKSKLQQFDDSN